MHKKCSQIPGRLTSDPTFRCSRCRGTACPIDGRPCNSVMLDEQPLEVVDSFRYLGDTICAGGGCETAIIARIRAAWVMQEFVILYKGYSLWMLCQGCHALCE